LRSRFVIHSEFLFLSNLIQKGLVIIPRVHFEEDGRYLQSYRIQESLYRRTATRTCVSGAKTWLTGNSVGREWKKGSRAALRVECALGAAVPNSAGLGEGGPNTRGDLATFTARNHWPDVQHRH
jgi:hypothetical protein